MIGILETVNRVVWGLPALLSVIGVGVILTVRTRFAQLRLFPAAVKKFIKQLTHKEDTQIPMHPLPPIL